MSPTSVDSLYVPAVYATAFGLLPPLVAITLALITKEVYSSLFVGIVTGALLYSNGNLFLGLTTMLFHEEGGLIFKVSSSSNTCILVFVTVLGILVALMNKAGGSYAFGDWCAKHIRTRKGAQFMTMLLGVLIFVDDGFNCMTVGNVMRSVTDRFNVSRAKLAYLLDATAAPICIIAPVSSWAAAVTYSVPEELHINGFSMFLRTIPYNFYSLTTLLMMALIIFFNIDFGLMKVHEDNAKKGDIFTTPGRPFKDSDEQKANPKGKVIDLVLPVFVLIVISILCMIYTGGYFEGASLIDAFGNCNAAYALVMSSVVTLIFTFILYNIREVISFKEFMECLPAGFRSMCEPMIILIMAWNLSGMTNLLGANIFIHDFVEGYAGNFKMFLPAIIFLVSVFLSFSTGTSWGTFSILIPIVCNVFAGNYEMLVISIAACLSGSVCGDHCSPISDTTIMSSAGAHCEHFNHVSTQLPYAITAAIISFIGYILAGIAGYTTNSTIAILSLPVTLAFMAVSLFILNKKYKVD